MCQLALPLRPVPRIKRRDDDYLNWHRLVCEGEAIEALIAARWPDEDAAMTPAEIAEYDRLNDASWSIHERAVAAFAPLVPRVKDWWA